MKTNRKTQPAKGRKQARKAARTAAKRGREARTGRSSVAAKPRQGGRKPKNEAKKKVVGGRGRRAGAKRVSSRKRAVGGAGSGDVAKVKAAKGARRVKGSTAGQTGRKAGAANTSRRTDQAKRSTVGGDIAGLSVSFSVFARVGPNREQRAVELDGRIRRPRGVDRDTFPRLADREAAAKKLVGAQRPEKLASLLAALAHPQRLRILTKLLATEATHRLLAKATGLKAGPLYHHIRELRAAALIGPKTRDLYVLTPKGRRAILAALAIGRLCG